MYLLRDAPQTTLTLSLILGKMIGAYFTAPNTTDDIISEMVDFIVEQYSHLHPLEIEHAFKLLAAQKLCEQVGNTEQVLKIETFHGTFNVSQLGKLLEGYTLYRGAIVAKIRKQQKDQFDTEAVVGRLSSFKPQTRIKQLFEIQTPIDWDSTKISWHDYTLLVNAGFIELEKGRKLEFFKKATDIRISKLTAEMYAANTYRITEIRNELEILKTPWTDWTDQVKHPVIVIAQRLMTVDCLNNANKENFS